MTRPLNFLFTTWEGGGNVTPALVVVRKLIARGHCVRVMSEACNRPESEAAGATFVEWRTAPSRKDRSRDSQTCRDWDAPTPQDALISVIRDIWCGPSLRYARDTIDELRREAADLVVTCEALFGTMAACESLGQPWATLCPNISLAPLPGVPPLGPGLPPATTDEERQMHRQIAHACQAIFDSGLPALNAARGAIGLGPLEHLLDQFRSATVELLATSPAFDFPAESLPPKVRYVGPQIADPHWAQPWQSPWPSSDARPLVGVGFSTTFQGHTRVLQNVVDALATLPVRTLVTLGGSIRPDEIRAADNCVVVDSAPHSQVMRQSALFVTHGGHGTVMNGVLARVPLLIIPHGRDQNDNAVRITARGAALSLTPDAPVESIRAACHRLLTDPAFKAAATRLGDRVAADAQHSTVVHELESAARGAKTAAA
ncbi:MAG TPA: glycosyltransferase [Tepidisphaeraceae bacterium]|jgi:MGT family glycosyltransferase